MRKKIDKICTGCSIMFETVFITYYKELFTFFLLLLNENKSWQLSNVTKSVISYFRAESFILSRVGHLCENCKFDTFDLEVKISFMILCDLSEGRRKRVVMPLFKKRQKGKFFKEMQSQIHKIIIEICVDENNVPKRPLEQILNTKKTSTVTCYNLSNFELYEILQFVSGSLKFASN